MTLSLLLITGEPVFRQVRRVAEALLKDEEKGKVHGPARGILRAGCWFVGIAMRLVSIILLGARSEQLISEEMQKS